MFKNKNFVELSNILEPNCVSIYIPTHRAGQATWDNTDALKLKNQILRLKKELYEKDFSEKAIRKFVRPLEKLQNDRSFWLDQSDCLAIFANEYFVDCFKVPVQTNELFFMGERFYLKPLIPMIKGQNRFFILDLNLHHIRLFDCTQYSISPVRIDDLLPTSIKEVQVNKAPNQLLAHADQRKNDITKLYRYVNEGLMEILHDEKAPMVLAGVDYLIPLFQEVCTYPQTVVNKHISGNIEYDDITLIHEKAWEQVHTLFDVEKRQALENFEAQAHTPRTTESIETIVKAAHHGRIDTLFLQNDANYWGHFDLANQKVQTNNPNHETCLLNLAAVQSTLKGANVFLLDVSDMPVEEEACAILRY